MQCTVNQIIAICMQQHRTLATIKRYLRMKCNIQLDEQAILRRMHRMKKAKT